MIDLDLGPLPQAEWNRLTAGLDGHCLVQSWEYAEAKVQTGPWRAERGLLKEGGAIVGAFQAMIRPLPYGLPGGLVWINRGPLRAAIEQDKRRRLADLMTAIKRHYTERRSYYLRLAPPVADSGLVEDALAAGGLTATPTPGWASAELDLSPDVDALRRGLRSKWRNTLNKAEREGVEVRSGRDDATFATFTEAYDRFLTERDFDTTVTPQLLTTLQRLQPADQRLTAFIAERDGELLGAALISRNGGRAEYLSGFVEEAGRSAGAGQILLWRSVVAMKEAGMTTFDLGGMDPDITPRGIYDFKDGLGGKPYRLAAEREAGGEGLLGRLVRWRVTGARSAA